MNRNYKSFHILTPIVLNLILFIITMASNSPWILFGVFGMIVTVIVTSGNFKDLKNGIIFFIPFMMVTVFINMVFSWEGKIILFYLFGKKFTLEALIYALILSFKLLIVVYLFRMLSIMVDSDRAVSYFSKKLPKSTLTLMIGFKLFPNMKTRLDNLREIYSIRGVSFEEKSLRGKIKGYVPIMSILLESSLEGAFDIGEAAYVRGFLSGKRSVYDNQRLSNKDCGVIFTSLLMLFVLIPVKLLEQQSYDSYLRLGEVNLAIVALIILNLILAVILIVFSKEK